MNDCTTTTTLCERHMMDSDYVAKRYMDMQNTRNHPRLHVRAHYRRLYQEAKRRLENSSAACEACQKARQEVA